MDGRMMRNPPSQLECHNRIIPCTARGQRLPERSGARGRYCLPCETHETGDGVGQQTGRDLVADCKDLVRHRQPRHLNDIGA